MTPYRFDPELADIVPTIPTASPADLPTAREEKRLRVLAAFPGDLTGLTVEDIHAPGLPGNPDVGLRVYRPDSAGPGLPCIYSVHGGGFAVGSVDENHSRNADWAREIGAVVVAVTYRLAPEHPYPAGFEDCYAGLLWTFESADKLGIDPARVAVHGISAGGGLAAAMTLYARDHDGPRLCFQFLSVPELDDRLDTVSATDFVDTPVWNRPRALASWDRYLGEGVRGGDSVPPYAAPARATDLSDLPPAYLSVMEFDPLRDEGIAYAQRLLHAGVPVELHLFPGAFHGSYRYPSAAVTRRELAEQTEVLRRALTLGGAGDTRPDR